MTPVGPALIAALASTLASGSSAQTVIDARVYDSAARFKPLNRANLVLNETITPHWRVDGRERFTYRRDLGDGRGVFFAIDAATGARRPAFDQGTVARGLSVATGAPVDADRLPFKDYDEVGSRAIRFSTAGKTWTCSVSKPGCDGHQDAPIDPMTIPSPDGKWLAFVKDYNLWIRSADGGESFALTTDGQAHYAYGATPECNPLITPKVLYGGAIAPVVLWSPDSRRLFTQKIDERNVRVMTLVQSTPTDGGIVPVARSWRAPFSTDPALPMEEPWVFDVASRTGHRVEMEPTPRTVITSIEGRDAWWSSDSRQVYLFARTRYYKAMSLRTIDPATGKARTIVSESARTFVESGTNGQRPIAYPLANGEVIWFSERDGRGHLYIYDAATGVQKRQLTKGDWAVRSVVGLDETAGFIFVTGTEREANADPYLHKIYRIRIRDGAITLLTPEEADHEVATGLVWAYLEPPPEIARSPDASRGISPSGRYFLDNSTRTDLANLTVLRRTDGKFIAEVEQADMSRLTRGGLTLPERFSAVAADGKTPLYGIILRPSTYDPKKSYPIIDALYPGPQWGGAHPRLFDTLFNYAQTYAELGFIVIQMDGRGTPGRSKAFLDETYGKLGLAGHLDDHVAVLRQLAKRDPSIDLARAGVVGGSAGGYATLRAMFTYPDVFKAGMAAAPYNNPKVLMPDFTEKFMGPESGSNYADVAVAPLAGGLKGKLLLTAGEMDWTVTPWPTLQIVDSLVKAHKDFEFVLAPNVDHSPLTLYGDPMLLRGWNFFVANLMGARPPASYAFPTEARPH